MTQQDKADIGVTGLAVMGRNLARNLARHGNVVALHNRSPERTRSTGGRAASKNPQKHVSGVARRVWSMGSALRGS